MDRRFALSLVILLFVSAPPLLRAHDDGDGIYYQSCRSASELVAQIDKLCDAAWADRKDDVVGSICSGRGISEPPQRMSASDARRMVDSKVRKRLDKEFPESLKKKYEAEARQKYPLITTGETLTVNVRYGSGFIEYTGKVREITRDRIRIGDKVVLFRELPSELQIRLEPDAIETAVSGYVSEKYDGQRAAMEPALRTKYQEELDKRRRESDEFYFELTDRERNFKNARKDALVAKHLPKYLLEKHSRYVASEDDDKKEAEKSLETDIAFLTQNAPVNNIQAMLSETIPLFYSGARGYAKDAKAAAGQKTADGTGSAAQTPSFSQGAGRGDGNILRSMVVLKWGPEPGLGFNAAVLGKNFIVTGSAEVCDMLATSSGLPPAVDMDGKPVEFKSLSFVSDRNIALLETSAPVGASSARLEPAVSSLPLNSPVSFFSYEKDKETLSRVASSVKGIGPSRMELKQQLGAESQGSPVFLEKTGRVAGVVTMTCDGKSGLSVMCERLDNLDPKKVEAAALAGLAEDMKYIAPAKKAVRSLQELLASLKAAKTRTVSDEIVMDKYKLLEPPAGHKWSTVFTKRYWSELVQAHRSLTGGNAQPSSQD